eukprot:jgi/Botrbrau1/8082/Bobra.0230s0009.2
MAPLYSGVNMEGCTSVRPFLTEADVEDAVTKLFGFATTSCTELPSYDDRNFKLECKIGDEVQDLVFKVHNSKDSANPEFLEAQSEAMLRLHARGLSCSVPLRLAGGSLTGFVQVPTHIAAVRMLTFLPGRTLPKQAQGFEHPSLHRVDVWDIRNAPSTIRQHLPLDTEKRELLLEVVEAFERDVVPVDGKLRRQVIHGDANFDNILLNAAGDQVGGILDFGDMVHTWLVAELAILTAYIMASHEGEWKEKCQAATHARAGYTEVVALNEEELAALPLLAASRLAVSLAMSSSTVEQDPANAEYLLDDQKPIWETLRMWRMHVDKA